MKAAQLRQSILQAAVQGKLVPQDVHDEPTNELIARIISQKEKINSKKKNTQLCTLINEDDALHDVPDTWIWCRLADVACSVNYGTSTKTHSDKDEIAVIRMNNIQNGKLIYDDIKYAKKENVDLPLLYLEIGDLLFNRTNSFELVGKSAVFMKNSSDYSFASYLIRVRLCEVEPQFICYYLNSEICRKKQIEPNATQQNGQANFNGSKLQSLFIPIPPLKEQQRIVAKVNELMTLCDELEAAEKELDKLEADFAEYLPKSILQAAVQGKLVSQNIHDEPATELLKRIQTEKAQLIKAGKIKKEKALPQIAEDEIPYDLPEGWAWCRLDEICEYIQRGRSPIYSEIEKIPVLSQKCVQWGGITLERAKFIDPSTIDKYGEERFLKQNDLLWNSTGHGTLGRISMVEFTNKKYSIVVADSHVTVIRPMSTFVNAKYLLAWFSGPTVQGEIVGKSSGSTNQIELATSTIKNYLVPLPPLAEQQRIVAKVDELLALCGKLKSADTEPYATPVPTDFVRVPEQPRKPMEQDERYAIAARGELVEQTSPTHRQARRKLFEDKADA